MTYILVYRGGRISDSARALKEAIPRARTNKRNVETLKRKPRMIVNWGNSYLPTFFGAPRLNKGEAVAVAANKLKSFEALKLAGVRIPTFWTTTPNRKGIVVARTILTGHSGAGIVVLRPDDGLVAAPLYTQYIKKSHEYRVHVFKGKAICIQEKRKREGFEQTDNQKLLRNYDNGWNFVTNDIRYPDANAKTSIEQEAIKAVDAIGLDFGAVDLVIGAKDGLPYILEINTAPAVSSPTVLEAYTTAFTGYANELG